MLTPCGKHSRFGNGYLYDAALKEKVPKNASYFFGISVHDYELKKKGGGVKNVSSKTSENLFNNIRAQSLYNSQIFCRCK
jgi:hypothetical protein